MDQLYTNLLEDPVADRQRLFASLIEAMKSDLDEYPRILKEQMTPFVEKWAAANRILFDEFNEIRQVCEPQPGELLVAGSFRVDQ